MSVYDGIYDTLNHAQQDTLYPVYHNAPSTITICGRLNMSGPVTLLTTGYNGDFVRYIQPQFFGGLILVRIKNWLQEGDNSTLFPYVQRIKYVYARVAFNPLNSALFSEVTVRVAIDAFGIYFYPRQLQPTSTYTLAPTDTLEFEIAISTEGGF